MVKRAIILVACVSLAGASAAQSQGFGKDCESRLPTATCKCMVGEFQQSQKGKIMLDSLDVMALPEAERPSALKDMLNRYGLKHSELPEILKGSSPMLDAAFAKCK